MKFQYLRRFHCVFAFVVAAVSLVQCCAAASADTRFLVAPIQLYGLANRLRALEGVHIIASAAGRKLAVHWLRSTDCWVAFNELFDVAHAEASELLVDVSEDPELHLLYDRTPVGDGRVRARRACLSNIPWLDTLDIPMRIFCAQLPFPVIIVRS